MFFLDRSSGPVFTAGSGSKPSPLGKISIFYFFISVNYLHYWSRDFFHYLLTQAERLEYWEAIILCPFLQINAVGGEDCGKMQKLRGAAIPDRLGGIGRARLVGLSRGPVQPEDPAHPVRSRRACGWSGHGL